MHLRNHVLITSRQSYQNSALREQKDQCYARREQRNPSLAALLGYLDETLLRMPTRIRAITDDNQLNDAEKVEGIRTLLNTHERSVSDDGVNLAALKRDLASELSEDDYYRILEARSVRIQNRISTIIKALRLQGEPGSRELSPQSSASRTWHTSSEGQEFEVRAESLNANYSFKYFGKGQGVSVYSFIDERNLFVSLSRLQRWGA
jgi:Tn3 transposase DDE domain